MIKKDMKRQRVTHRGYAREKLNERHARKDAPPDL